MAKVRKIQPPLVCNLRSPPTSIVEIPFSDGTKDYGRVLESPLMAFYAVRSHRSLSLSEILSLPVAFKVWVMKSAITSGRWSVIGQAPLEAELEAMPWFFRQDAITKALSLQRNGIERPATREECETLEAAAVWSAIHVEDRMADQVAGKANKWVESVKIQTQK